MINDKTLTTNSALLFRITNFLSSNQLNKNFT